MPARIASVCSAVFLALVLALPISPTTRAGSPNQEGAEDGVVKVKSTYPMDETVARLKRDIADKGIMFFLAVDQSRLAAEAGVKLRPSTLLIFGNPGLGAHFMTARPEAGLDWPVRLLVIEDETGDVWAVYTDFAWIARRHRITDREAEFAMASKVIASITSSVRGN